jgi:single-stranded-DNA-specific exonuclease
VLAVTAHAAHRAAGLRDRVGGFAVTTWAAIEDDPARATAYAHVVAVDPPANAGLLELAEQLPGDGWTHLAWGGAELELARRVLAWELDLRPQVADAYRGLRAAGAGGLVAGRPLEAILRGAGPQQRSGAMAGRILRVLAELGLVALDAERLAVGVPAPAGRTELERSPAYGEYANRLQAGLAFLDSLDRGAEPLVAAA